MFARRFPSALDRDTLLLVLAVALGAAGLVVAWIRLDPLALQVVTYRFNRVPLASWLPAYLPLAASVLIFPAALRLLSLHGDGRTDRTDLRPQAKPSLALWARIGRSLHAFLPACVMVGVAAWWVAAGPGYVGFCLLVAAVGWLVSAAAGSTGWKPVPQEIRFSIPRSDRAALWFLGVAVAAATIWHASMQVAYWRHLLLGYADFGLYTRELEYCLPWSHVADRFSNTRLALHFEPLFYALAPLYAVFRSPLFLMVVGPLALNLAAIAFYRMARHRGAAPAVALAIGLGWLLLPSVSRMPYAGTYGFESVYLAVPLIAFALDHAQRRQWGRAHILVGFAVLCQETICGLAIGWALYLSLVHRRYGEGAVVLAATLAYLTLAIFVIIPHFAPAHDYERFEMFGRLTPQVVLERLARPRTAYYLLALLSPLFVGLARDARLLLVALPTLGAILLLGNEDYLSIKFWHQSSILPVFYAAAVAGVTAARPVPIRARSASEGFARAGRTVGPSFAERSLAPGARTPGHWLGLLAAILLAHQVLGFSPLAQAYRLYRATPALTRPDPRMQLVEWVRRTHDPQSTDVIATERLAAHFIDYHTLQTAEQAATRLTPRGVATTSGGQDARPTRAVVADLHDTWDPLVRSGRIEAFLADLERMGFRPVRTSGSIIVLEREPGSP